jgi:3-dehydroquinate dehydratase/shikimate dehydrogenase
MALVVSVIADAFAALARAAQAQAPLADLVELRLDRIGHPGKPALAALVRELAKPLIVSCNGAEAYGSFAGSIDELCSLLHDAAEAGARFVTIDWTRSLELGGVKAPCHRIVARHELEGTPEDLPALHAEVQAVLHEGDVTKLVTHARSCEDGLRFLAWLATSKGVVGFCAGEAGSFTRVLAPIFGSPFVFCAPARIPGEPALGATAPGQLAIDELRAAHPPGGVSQETAIFGVVGNPARHSLSPRVLGMALKAARLDAVFVAFEPQDFARFFALAQAVNCRGLSVTAPFKEAAAAAAGVREEAIRKTGAANTLVREKSGWRAANTDVPAIRETLEAALVIHARSSGKELALSRCKALTLGSGGAARAAAWALRSVGAGVTVAGRDLARVQALARELDCAAIAWSEIPRVEHDILVHTTPMGSRAMAGELAIAEDWIRPGTLVLDAVYRPLATPLLRAAKRRGCTAVPGGEWFVRQAAHQFRLFTNADAPEALLRKTFESAILADGDR